MAYLKRATEYVKRNGTANREVYQSYRWQKYSRQYRKLHRLCVRCKANGKVVVSECVDHTIPIEEGGSIWDHSNHQALCLSCHSIKTHEDKIKYAHSSRT